MSPGKLLEMQIFRPQPRSTEPYTLGKGQQLLFLTSSPVDCKVQRSLRSTELQTGKGEGKGPRRGDLEERSERERGRREGREGEEGTTERRKVRERQEKKPEKWQERGNTKESHRYPKMVISD